LAAAAVFAMLSMPAEAGAQTTRYASATGSGAACIQGNPCSLDTAVEGASVADGDEAILAPGTYTNLAGDFLNVLDAINIHGQAGSPRPVIQENAFQSTFFVNANATISHLEVENSGTGGALALSGFGAGGINVTDVIARTAHSNDFTCRLLNVTMRDTICRNVGTGDAVGFNGDFANAVLMRNVTIVSTGGDAIDLAGGGTFTNMPWDLKNVIARGGASSDVDIRATLNVAMGSIAITLANSNYDTESDSPGATITDPGTGTNQMAAPQFVDEATGDLHQLASSPTRNAGVADMLGSSDLDGDPRTLEGIPDIGADEFAPDGDGDGVPDYADNCVSQPGPSSNAGCPETGGGDGGDAIPPDTTITDGPSGKTKKKSATIAFSGSDVRAVASFQCKLDSGSFESCTSPKTYSGLKKGSHTVSVRAVDTADNVDLTPATRTWTVKKKKRKKK
jgi:hypothetical protein